MSYTLPKRDTAPRGTPHLSDESFLSDYQALGLVLAASVDAAGKPRQGATVTVFAEDGALKAVVRDRHERMAVFLTLDPSADPWGQIDAYLVKHPNQWRADKEPRK